MDHVVVDVEIEKTIEELPNGWDDTHLMGISVACVYEYQSDRFRFYGTTDREDLKNRLMLADRVTGFNTWNFDFPVIWGYSKSQWIAAVDIDVRDTKELLKPRSNDLLRRIWIAKDLDPDNFDPKTHGGVGLEAVTMQTLGVGKIGHGAEAPRQWARGEVLPVVTYCCDDVALERDLSDFIDRYKYVLTPQGRLPMP